MVTVIFIDAAAIAIHRAVTSQMSLVKRKCSMRSKFSAGARANVGGLFALLQRQRSQRGRRMRTGECSRTCGALALIVDETQLIAQQGNAVASVTLVRGVNSAHADHVQLAVVRF